MTPQSEAEAIDFKPFFDMIVGILFILLIFIAAQLFFTQWDDPAQIEARERSRQISYQWQQQSTDLLQDIAARLRQSGVSVEVNATTQSLTVPLSELVTIADGGAIQIDSRSDAVGKTLADRLRCIPGQPGAAPSDCPSLTLLRLAGIVGELRVPDVRTARSLTPERYAYFISALLSAQFLRGAPELAAITGSGGVPALRVVGVNLEAPKGGGSPSRAFRAEFRFSTAKSLTEQVAD